jgi:hypothetical protein
MDRLRRHLAMRVGVGISVYGIYPSGMVGKRAWTLSAIKLRIALAMPSIVAFVYLVDGTLSWVEKVVTAGLVGMAIFMAMAVATIASHVWLDRGKEFDQLGPSLAAQPMFVAGMILVSLAWAWGQIDRDRVVRRVAACVHDHARSDDVLVDRTLVLDCYRNEETPDGRDD